MLITNDTAQPQTYWFVNVRDGAIERAESVDRTEPHTVMGLERGVLHMEATVPATDRVTAIVAARDAWRDLAANIEGGS